MQRFNAVPFWGWLVVLLMTGGIFGLGTFTFSYAEGFTYLSDDPRACANCHVMRDQYDRWSRGSHRAVAVCNDCHTPHSSLVEKYFIKGLNGFNHSRAFTLGDYPSTIRITALNRQVAYESCLACHANVVSQIAHIDGKDPTDCLSCHAGVGHGRQ